jgi:PAS domain S-box-containing protein
MMSFSAAGRIQSWNPAAEALFGYSADEAIGAPAGLLVQPGSPEGPTGAFDRAIRGETVTGDVVRVAKDGTLIDIAITAAPMRTPDGSIIGVSVAMRDIRERKRAEAALRESEEQFRGLAEHIPQLAWMANADGGVFWYNQRWYDYTGTTPKDMEGWGRQSVHDPKVLPEVVERWKASLTSGQPFDMVFPLKGADGVFRPFLTRVEPMRDGDGRVVRWFGSNTDISAERAAEERQRLLVNELNHRVKNTLATVQAIAAQTLRSSATDKEARDAFEARLLALSKVHNVLTRENWETASLGDIAAEVLAPHGGEDAARFRIDGPDVRLEPRLALPIAMALHELATNAVKYGALSNGSGRVAVDWRIDAAPQGRTLRLRWTERGGPPAAPPARKGFGSRLIERSLALELGGTVTLDFEESGVACSIDALLPGDGTFDPAAPADAGPTVSERRQNPRAAAE